MKKQEKTKEINSQFITYQISDNRSIFFTYQQAFDFLVKDLKRLSADLSKLEDQVNGYEE